MMKNTLYPLMILLTGFFFACQNSNPELEGAEEIKDRSAQKIVTGGKPSDDMKANAIKEGDYKRQIEWSLGLLQESLRNSSGKVNGLGEISVLLDENFQMVIRNKHKGDVTEQRVSLANLDNDIKNIVIISDAQDNPNPGIKFKVLDGKPGIETYKNGTKGETSRELELLFAERKMVHKVLSAMTNAVNSARGLPTPEAKG